MNREGEKKDRLWAYKTSTFSLEHHISIKNCDSTMGVRAQFKCGKYYSCKIFQILIHSLLITIKIQSQYYWSQSELAT